jgi:predicted nucleic acid-binding protein
MKDKPYSGELERFSKSRIKGVQNVLAVRMLLNELDIGESEALVLALENNINDILMDEYKGLKKTAGYYRTKRA